MTQTHITYETAKALKSFCPELPEPMDGMYIKIGVSSNGESYPRYALHDILSKPFCEAFADRLYRRNGPQFTTASAECHFMNLAGEYWRGGLPAVEVELIKMMEGK